MKLQNYHSAMFKYTKMLIQPLQPSCDAQDAAICWQVDQMGHTSQHYRFEKSVNSSDRIEEATLVPTVAGSATQGSRVHDHALLSVTVMIKGTLLRTLVDNGAIRSFINEKLQLCPPLRFIGAYSSLEMANGETVVSTGIAPDILVSIMKIEFRLDLTAVRLMEGFDIVLGKDLLDMVNPLIDWHSNRMYIKQGDQLHIVFGDPNVQPCGIKD